MLQAVTRDTCDVSRATCAAPAAAFSLWVQAGDLVFLLRGSRLIAQKFTRPEYFQPRPSAVDYNAASTGGSNYGPSNPDHLKAVQERVDAITKQEGVTADRVPSEMVTASGAGMDPHIPPNGADQRREGRFHAALPYFRVRCLARRLRSLGARRNFSRC